MKKVMALVLSFVLGISMIGCSDKAVATVNGEKYLLNILKLMLTGLS